MPDAARANRRADAATCAAPGIGAVGHVVIGLFAGDGFLRAELEAYFAITTRPGSGQQTGRRIIERTAPGASGIFPHRYAQAVISHGNESVNGKIIRSHITEDAIFNPLPGAELRHAKSALARLLFLGQWNDFLPVFPHGKFFA